VDGLITNHGFRFSHSFRNARDDLGHGHLDNLQRLPEMNERKGINGIFWFCDIPGFIITFSV
jgi:hypothetical protein